MSRTQYLVKNAQINIVFYLINILLTFFSRRLFLDNLGAEFLGLNATIANLLGFLSLAELGIGTAITYLLYQPLAHKDFNKVNKIISLLNYYYKRLSLAIMVLGLIGSLFLPFFFNKNGLSIYTIYAAFYSYLIINLIAYFFNFKQILVYADQKAFLLKKVMGLCAIFKVVAQIIAIIFLKTNIYVYLGIEIVFAIIQSIALNWLIDKTYHWLKITPIANGNSEYKGTLLKKSKQIFSHEIGTFVLTQTDQLLIYAYTSLKMVTFYNNYLMVVQYAVSLISQPFLSLNSGIGDLVASSNREKAYQTFRELLLLKYWIAGCVIFVIYQTIDPLIELWLGKSYLLDKKITIILLLNFFITITRKPLDVFLQAFGIFHDTWAPWAEAGLNLILSIILGYLYGIFGILLGTFISVGLIVCLWKPYLLFTQGFKRSPSLYFTTILFYLIQLFVVAFVAVYILNNIKITIPNKYLMFITHLAIVSATFVILYSVLMALFAKESKYLVNRLLALWK